MDTQATREDELRARIAQIFKLSVGSDPVAIHWETIAASSSYRCLSVSAKAQHGPALRLFVKDFSVPLIYKHDITERAQREHFVYKELLNPHVHGPPQLLGYDCSPSNDRCRLFLEFVEGAPVSHHPFPTWVQAASWLGKMQTSVAEPLVRHGPRSLKIHNELYFDLQLAKAIEAASAVEPSASRRLQPVIDLYPSLKSFFADGPRTLVHGSYEAKQIHVRRGAGRDQICPLDWEIAGFGSHLYDLCLLADGYETPELDELVAAYNAAATWLGPSLPTVDEVRKAMLLARLLRTLKWLRQSGKRRYESKWIDRFLESAIGLSHDCETMVG